MHCFLWVIYLLLAIAFKVNNLELGCAVKHTLFMLPIHVVTYYGFGLLAVDRFFEKKKYLLFAIVSIVLFGFLYTMMMNFVVPLFEEYYRSLPGSPINREERVVAITIILSMSVSTLFHILENKIEQERNSQYLLDEHNKARLLYLKAQINPHFLFNALNNLYSLAVTKSDRTPQMVLNLADLLRYSIYEGQKETVLICDEILHIKKYIQLYQSTLEEPANIKFNYKKNISNEAIEPMILIPLIENCIKHGDLATNTDAFVLIELNIEADQLLFTTFNSISTADVQKDAEGGVGLENIKTRLALNYHDDYVFQVEECVNTFKVSLAIKNLKHL